MAKLYGVVLIITLVAASGFIAYVGDILGRRMGRKRLSLFGMRPRHTAIAVSVVAGMLITMFTLAVAMIASRDVRQGLLHAAEMRRQQTELTRDLGETQARVKYLDTSRQQAERRAAEARKGVEAAERSLQEAKAEYQQTDQRRVKAEAQRQEAEAQRRKAEELLEKRRAELSNAEKLVGQMNAQLMVARRDLNDLSRGLLLERATPVLVVAGQPLDVELIQGGQPKPAIRAQLNDLVARLNAKARQAGAKPPPGSDEAVMLDRPVMDESTGKLGVFTKQQVLVAVTDRIFRERGGVIVRAESAINSYRGEPIRADLRLYNNRLVYRKGEVLAEARVDGSASEPALMNVLVGLLKAKVGPDAMRKNMMPRISATGSDPFNSSASSVGDMTYNELFDKIEELRRIGGPAKVSVFAAEDAWTIGPLKVDMRIEAAGNGRGALRLAPLAQGKLRAWERESVGA